MYVSGIGLTFFGLSRITGKTELAITHHVNEYVNMAIYQPLNESALINCFQGLFWVEKKMMSQISVFNVCACSFK